MSIPIPSGMMLATARWQLGHTTQTEQLAGARGLVRFEATAAAVSYPDVTVLPSPVTARVASGVMEPVDLTVNDPDLWNWRVTPQFGLDWAPFHVDVPPGGVDLATAAVVPGKGPVRAVTGPPGAGIAFHGEKDTLADLPADPIVGDGWMIDNDLHVWSGHYWVNAGPIRGPQGIQGVRGPQGVQGELGPANTLTVGTVTGGDEADASITGEAPDQSLSLVLPRGPQGIQGVRGPQGDQGVQGDRGPEGPYGGTEVTDPQVASWIGDHDTETGTKLDHAYRRDVSVAEYGAVGDGVTDDTAAFTMALAGGNPVHVPKGTFLVSGATATGPVEITLDPGAVIESSTAAAAISIRGTEADVDTALTVTAEPGTTTITAPGHGVTAGDWVRLASDRLYDASSTVQTHGELIQVEASTVDEITTTTPIAGGPYVPEESAYVRKVNLIDGVRISGRGKIRGIKDSSLRQTGLDIRLARGVHITGIRTEGFDLRHIFLSDVVDFEVSHVRLDWAVAQSTGYAISVADASMDGVVQHCRFWNTRHAFSTNNQSPVDGIVRRILVTHNISRTTSVALGGSQGGGNALDTHSAAEDIWINYNQVFNALGAGINLECRSGTIIGNHVYGAAIHGINFHNESDLPGSIVVTDNIVDNVQDRGIYITSGVRGADALTQGVTVSRNVVRRAGTYGIQVGIASTPTIVGVNMNDNRVEDNVGGTAILTQNIEKLSASGNVAIGGGTGISLSDASPYQDPGYLSRSIPQGVAAITPFVQYLGIGSGGTLDSITGGARGQFVTLRNTSVSGSTEVRSAVAGGNIRLVSPMTIVGAHDTLTLAYNGNSWIEVSRAKF